MDLEKVVYSNGLFEPESELSHVREVKASTLAKIAENLTPTTVLFTDPRLGKVAAMGIVNTFEEVGSDAKAIEVVTEKKGVAVLVARRPTLRQKFGSKILRQALWQDMGFVFPDQYS